MGSTTINFINFATTKVGSGVTVVCLLHFAGGSSHRPEPVVLLIDPLFCHVDLVDGLRRRVNYLRFEGGLANAEPVLVNVADKPTALVDGHFGVLFGHSPPNWIKLNLAY